MVTKNGRTGEHPVSTAQLIHKQGLSRTIYDDRDYISVAEAAEKLHKHRTTIYRWLRKGQLGYLKLAGHMFVSRIEIMRLLSSG